MDALQSEALAEAIVAKVWKQIQRREAVLFTHDVNLIQVDYQSFTALQIAYGRGPGAFELAPGVGYTLFGIRIEPCRDSGTYCAVVRLFTELVHL